MMDDKIRIITVPTDPRQQLRDVALMRFLDYINKAPDDLFEEGDALKIDTYKDSNLADLSEPAALEQTRQDEPPVAVILAVLGRGEVIGQMRMYDAHRPLPLNVEDDFGGSNGILAKFRRAHVHDAMVYLGALATNKHRVRGTSTIKGIFRRGLIFATEVNYRQAFACINPRHVGHYKEYIGFHPVAVTKEVKVIQAPGVLIRTSPEEIKMEYFAPKVASS